MKLVRPGWKGSKLYVPGFFKNPLPGEVTANCKACKPEAVFVPCTKPEAWHVPLQFPFTVNERSERAPEPPTVTALCSFLFVSQTP
jgi:hypothetical protein